MHFVGAMSVTVPGACSGATPSGSVAYVLPGRWPTRRVTTRQLLLRMSSRRIGHRLLTTRKPTTRNPIAEAARVDLPIIWNFMPRPAPPATVV